MRHIVLGCLLTLFSTTLFAQLKTDLALLNLKGPVKKWEKIGRASCRERV